MLARNLQNVETKIQGACQRAGRSRDEITLIAVSKTKPTEMLAEIYQEGVRDFGENKVQELTNKYEQLPQDINWHMIGHLQRNKVKYIIDKVKLIHSVDSLRLAEAIEQEAAKKNVVVDVLIEVNVAAEESKFGLIVDQVIPLLEQIIASNAQKHFCFLRDFRQMVRSSSSLLREYVKMLQSVDIAQKNIDNISVDILSMGMTNDYEVAIEEGATMVRVGTGIFGERDYGI